MCILTEKRRTTEDADGAAATFNSAREIRLKTRARAMKRYTLEGAAKTKSEIPAEGPLQRRKGCRRADAATAAALSIQGVDCGLKGTADPTTLGPHSAVRPVHDGTVADLCPRYRFRCRDYGGFRASRVPSWSAPRAPRPLLASALIGCV